MMNIQICINSLVLGQGLKKIITEHLSGAVVKLYFFERDPFPPDIVLFDSRDKLDSLKKEFGDCRFICIDLGLKDSELACLLFCHGIHGIISPGLDVDKFCKALHAVYAGEFWVEQKHLKALLKGERSLPDRKQFKGLSVQDKRIISLVKAGKKNRVIANMLCLSEATVKAHLSRIYRTLKVENRSSLVALAVESDWISEVK